MIIDGVSTKPGQWKCLDTTNTDIYGYEHPMFDDREWEKAVVR